jgi:hypothetical protein
MNALVGEKLKMNKYILGFACLVQSLALGVSSNTISLTSNKIVLPLDDARSIVICLEKNLGDVDRDTDASFFMAYGDDTYSLLGTTRISFAARRLRDTLTSALINGFELHDSIMDIGYSFNEWWQNKFNVVEKECDGRNVWVGYKHMILWGYPQPFTGWIYTRKSDIYFELALAYGGPVTCPFTGKYYPANDTDTVIPYEQWKRDHYGIIFSKVLSKNIAVQWLEQANYIIKIIDINIAKMRVTA